MRREFYISKQYGDIVQDNIYELDPIVRSIIEMGILHCHYTQKTFDFLSIPTFFSLSSYNWTFEALKTDHPTIFW